MSVFTEEQFAAIDDVLAERRRQIFDEGWTPDHDDEHSDGSMALAAACYAAHTHKDDAGEGHMMSDIDPAYATPCAPREWPWDKKWWKPKSRRRDLVRAAALIIAEIERLDRAGSKTEPRVAVSQDAELPVRGGPIAGPAVDAFNRGEGRDELAQIVGRAAMECAKPGEIGVTAEMIAEGRALPFRTVYRPTDGRDYLTVETIAAIYRAMHAARPKRAVTDEEARAALDALDDHHPTLADARRLLQAFADGRGL